MRVLLIAAIIFFPIFSKAQLKYRAKEDFGLKGKVKTYKVINQSIEDGDTIFSMFDGEEKYYFSKEGVLIKKVLSNWSFIDNSQTIYEYNDTVLTLFSTEDTTLKGVYITYPNGDIKIEAQLKKNEVLETGSDAELFKKTYSFFTHHFYNKKGLLQKYITYEADKLKDTAYFFRQVSFKYNKQGLLVEKQTILNDSLGNHTTSFKYDKIGELVEKEVSYHAESRKLYNNAITHYVNKPEENLVKITEKSPYKYFRPRIKEKYYYHDKEGNLIKELIYNTVENNTHFEDIITYEIEYYD